LSNPQTEPQTARRRLTEPQLAATTVLKMELRSVEQLDLKTASTLVKRKAKL
jgi:hypothetical protein